MFSDDVWNDYLEGDEPDCPACKGRGVDRWGNDCPDCGGLGTQF